MDTLILVNKNNVLKSNIDYKEIIKTKCRTFDNEMMLVHVMAEEHLQKMLDDASSQEIKLCVSSGYRSIKEQEEIYDNGNNSRAAVPGTSEHHTGLAIDIVNTSMTYEELVNNPFTFEKTKEFEWISKNCYKYGFILRYPKGKENITGIPYEPWHYRYVGKEHAESIMNSNVTLEEYLENIK